MLVVVVAAAVTTPSLEALRRHPSPESLASSEKVEERWGLWGGVAVSVLVSVSEAFGRCSSCRVGVSVGVDVGVGCGGGGIETKAEVEVEVQVEVVAWCGGKEKPGRSSGFSERRPFRKDRAVA